MAQTLPRLSINWDITYACPLRCSFCYSESGRRAARHLDPPRILRVVDTLISARILQLSFGGGEPILVPGLEAAATRLQAASIPRYLYTSGYLLDRPRAETLVPLFTAMYVSIDGAYPGTHDHIRGRKGSFERAIRALGILCDLVRARRAMGEEAPHLGVEFTAVRANFPEIAAFCCMIGERFPAVDNIAVGVAVPGGLANRAGYADAELLSDEELAALRNPAFVDRIRRTMRGPTHVSVSDSWWLLHPALAKINETLVQIEPDGGVRAFPTYEGTVGNLVEEPLETIWSRVQARHRDPYVMELLSNVGTMKEWSAAARKMDLRFASPADLLRISRRKEYSA